MDNERPQRTDGKSWHSRHIQAAELRAQNVHWADIAKKLGVSESAAQNYAGIGGFKELVAWFDYRLAKKRYEAIEKECIELVVEGKLEALKSLKSGAIDGDVDAAWKFLEAIGFVERNKAMARLITVQSQADNDAGDVETGDLIIERPAFGAPEDE